jgi:hypothetical protein
MKKTLFLWLLLSSSLQAQHLCLSYQVDIDDTKAVVAVYAQSDTSESQALASYTQLLFFSNEKANFQGIDFNEKVWDATFGNSNPSVQQSKGKQNAYLSITAVDMQPSSLTTISGSTLLYTAQFNARDKQKLKKSDFSLFFMNAATSENNYATYEGNSFPIQVCEFEEEEMEEEDIAIPFVIAPNPACGEVQIILDNPLLTMATCTIFDLQGNVLFRQVIADDLPSSLLNISALSKGLYFIQLQSDTQKWVRKLMVSGCGGKLPAVEATSTSLSNSVNN